MTSVAFEVIFLILFFIFIVVFSVGLYTISLIFAEMYKNMIATNIEIATSFYSEYFKKDRNDVKRQFMSYV